MSQDNGNSNGNGKSSDKGNGVHNKDWAESPFSDESRATDDIAPLARAQYRGVQFTQEVDGIYRDPQGRALRRLFDGTFDVLTPVAPFAGRQVQRDGEIRPHEWFWDEWIPMGQCTALSGVTGVRKSTFMLQLMIAAATGQPYFLGRSIRKSSVMGLFCEDDAHELIWRTQHIFKRYQIPLSDFDNKLLSIRSFVGIIETELVWFTPSGQMQTTGAFDRLEAELMERRPALLVLDTLPDFFGGNEINRRQSSQFIRFLDGVGQKYNCAIIYSHHPSLEGERSKSGRSGNTGWEGKTRSYLTLTYDKKEDDKDEDDKDSPNRILTRVSSNYAKGGVKLDIVVLDHSFILRDDDKTQPPKETGIVRDLKVRSRFMELLERAPDMMGYASRLSHATSHYAPREFHELDRSISEEEFKAAMDYLLREKRIRIDNHFEYGGRKKGGVIIPSKVE